MKTLPFLTQYIYICFVSTQARFSFNIVSFFCLFYIVVLFSFKAYDKPIFLLFGLFRYSTPFSDKRLMYYGYVQYCRILFS